MLWDTPEVPLPGDLLILWNRAKLGQKKLDLKSFLEQLPLWAEIPARAPDNNHRQDGKNVRDKMYKFWSQTILHLLRSQAVLHSVLKDWAGMDEENGEIVVLSQQHYQIMCELYQQILEEGKRSSIPGSVIKEDNILFQKEDITNEQNQLKINRAGSSSFKGFGGLKGGFRPGGFRFRGGGFKGNYSFRGQSGTVFKGKGGFKGRGKEIPSQPIASHLMIPHPKGPEVPEFPRPAVPKFQRPEVPIFPRPAVPSCQDCANQSVINPFLSLRKNLCWWKEHSPPEVFKIIQFGIQPQWELPPVLSKTTMKKSDLEVEKAKNILTEYQKVGAVKICGDLENTGHLVPWFVLSKTENNKEKHRLICDCRELNQFFQTKNFRLDHIQTIFPFLRQKMWAAKIDLKDAYFHLELGNQLKRFMRLQVGDQIWEFQAACFGLNILPRFLCQS